MAAVPAPTVDLEYTLDDKYTRREGRIYLSGVQALVRLPLMQALRDKAAGLKTAGYVSGYRGSPLGGLDQALWSAKKHLKGHDIEFQSGLNEDLAATMVWGSQQANLFPGAKYDGVFSMWYGKGPGVDRCGDVFKHGNAAGTSKFGGVLALDVAAVADGCARYDLTPYDYVYLAVARERGVPLATFDAALLRACAKAGVPALTDPDRVIDPGAKHTPPPVPRARRAPRRVASR